MKIVLTILQFLVTETTFQIMATRNNYFGNFPFFSNLISFQNLIKERSFFFFSVKAQVLLCKNLSSSKLLDASVCYFHDLKVTDKTFVVFAFRNICVFLQANRRIFWSGHQNFLITQNLSFHWKKKLSPYDLQNAM